MEYRGNESHFAEYKIKKHHRKYLVVIIYDILENKRRAKFEKYLQAFGFCVQNTAFEALIDKRTYEKLILGIPRYISGEDGVAVYKVKGAGEIKIWGEEKNKR